MRWQRGELPVASTATSSASSGLPAVQQVLVFGSRARGSHRPESDIDLAVVAPTMSSAVFAQPWAELDSLPLIFKLDVLHWDRLGQPALKDRITRDGQVVRVDASPAPATWSGKQRPANDPRTWLVNHRVPDLGRRRPA